MSQSAFNKLKVADFTWVAAGPLLTKYLADFGATVVHVETSKRPDTLRLAGPYKDGKPGINRTALFAFFNANKYSLALDLGHPKARAVAKRLVMWSDVVAENFVPGQMESWGLGYDDLKKLKPDIIMIRSSNFGQTGPYSKLRGYGIQLMGFAGFPNAVGWPDRGPTPICVAYTDLIAPRFSIATLAAALDYRNRTGEGQLIDISQLEAGLHFLAPAVLDYVTNQREMTGQGNSCPGAAPHGVYQCREEDRWCAIAVFSDEEWQAFCRVLADCEWTSDAKFSTLLGRKENEDELDRLVEEWTMKHSPEQVTELMQAAGVPAGVVKNAKELFEDPQLRERNYYWELNHHEIGPLHHRGQVCQLSKTPAQPRMPSACLGEHTEYVCTKLLGMTDTEFKELVSDNVLV